LFEPGFRDMEDQASGLRRLLGTAPLKVLALAGGGAGAGATTIAASLAAALAATGAEVLLVDENANHGNIADQLGVCIRFELIHALTGERTLQQVVRRASPALSRLCLLAAARGARELALGGRNASGTLAERLRAIGPAPDYVIIDSADGSVSRLIHADEATIDPVVVVGASREAIKAGYALIKNLSRETGAGEFRVVVNRVQNEAEARAIFSNIAGVARRHAGVVLEYLGWMPNDPQVRLARSAQRTVNEAFPLSAAAVAARRLAHLVRYGTQALQPSNRADAPAAERRGTHHAIHSGLAGYVGAPLNGHPRGAVVPSFS
jgi:flagellar biosynthesis protein FlhG